MRAILACCIPSLACLDLPERHTIFQKNNWNNV